MQTKLLDTPKLLYPFQSGWCQIEKPPSCSLLQPICKLFIPLRLLDYLLIPVLKMSRNKDIRWVIRRRINKHACKGLIPVSTRVPASLENCFLIDILHLLIIKFDPVYPRFNINYVMWFVMLKSMNNNRDEFEAGSILAVCINLWG